MSDFGFGHGASGDPPRDDGSPVDSLPAEYRTVDEQGREIIVHSEPRDQVRRTPPRRLYISDPHNLVAHRDSRMESFDDWVVIGCEDEYGNSISIRAPLSRWRALFDMGPYDR